MVGGGRNVLEGKSGTEHEATACRNNSSSCHKQDVKSCNYRNCISVNNETLIKIIYILFSSHHKSSQQRTTQVNTHINQLGRRGGYLFSFTCLCAVSLN